jgi:hypothetical protein
MKVGQRGWVDREPQRGVRRDGAARRSFSASAWSSIARLRGGARRSRSDGRWRHSGWTLDVDRRCRARCKHFVYGLGLERGGNERIASSVLIAVSFTVGISLFYYLICRHLANRWSLELLPLVVLLAATALAFAVALQFPNLRRMLFRQHRPSWPLRRSCASVRVI